jgi:peroxiredoxin
MISKALSVFAFICLIAPDMYIPGYEIGDVVEDFSLLNVDGKQVSLEGLGNVDGAIIVFTCNTCPYSKMYEQRIIDLHRKYQPLGYPVVAVQPNDPKKSPGDSFEKMKSRAQGKDYPFPYVLDETQDVTKKFGATNTPHVYVLEKAGRTFAVRYIGAIDNNARSGDAATIRYVENAVDDLLAGKQVGVKSTKAIGCGIKWK